MSGIRLSLTRAQAITLSVRLEDLAQLEPECEDIQKLDRKLRRAMERSHVFASTEGEG